MNNGFLKAVLIMSFMMFLVLPLRVHAESYEYDELGRVVRVTGDDGSVYEYKYDANGNILSVTVAVSGMEMESTQENGTENETTQENEAPTENETEYSGENMTENSGGNEKEHQGSPEGESESAGQDTGGGTARNDDGEDSDNTDDEKENKTSGVSEAADEPEAADYGLKSDAAITDAGNMQDGSGENDVIQEGMEKKETGNADSGNKETFTEPVNGRSVEEDSQKTPGGDLEEFTEVSVKPSGTKAVIVIAAVVLILVMAVVFITGVRNKEKK